MTRAVLITGGSGQLGRALRAASWPAGWELVAPARDMLDLADPASIATMVASRPWTLVINAAAFTAVDAAEREVVTAWQVNALAPAALAVASAASGIPMIQLSTDYVFAGHAAGAYETDAPVGPISVYGASKEGGEQAVRTANPRHAIIRTAWLVSAHGHNFVNTMLRLAREREEVRVVADQHGAPTSADDLAEAIVAIAERLVDDDRTAGTWHFSNAGQTTWHGFAEQIFTQAAARGMKMPKLVPLTTAQYPTPARRPANSLLSTASLSRDFGIVPRPWPDALSDILHTLIGKKT